MIKRGSHLLKQLWTADPQKLLSCLAVGAVGAALMAAEAHFQLPDPWMMALVIFIACSFLISLARQCANDAQRAASDDPLSVERGLIVITGLLFLFATSATAVIAYITLSLWEDRLWMPIGAAAASVAIHGTLSWIAADSAWGDSKKD